MLNKKTHDTGFVGVLLFGEYFWFLNLGWFIFEKQMKYTMWNDAYKRTIKTKQYKQN